MIKNLFLPSLAIIVGVMQPAAFSAVVFSDNFDSHTANSTLPTGALPRVWGSTSSGTSGTGSFSSLIKTDSGNVFGSGTSNQYLEIVASNIETQTNHNIGGNIYPSPGLGTVGQISFDFVQAAAFTNSLGFHIRLGVANGNGGMIYGIALVNGNIQVIAGGANPGGPTLATYNYGVENNLTFVFNNSTTATTYGDYSLAAGAGDIWLNGAKVATVGRWSGIATGAHPLGTNITELNFLAKSSASAGNPFNATMLIDNVVAQDMISVPEPSLPVMLGASSLLALASRRRRARG